MINYLDLLSDAFDCFEKLRAAKSHKTQMNILEEYTENEVIEQMLKYSQKNFGFADLEVRPVGVLDEPRKIIRNYFRFQKAVEVLESDKKDKARLVNNYLIGFTADELYLYSAVLKGGIILPAPKPKKKKEEAIIKEIVEETEDVCE